MKLTLAEVETAVLGELSGGFDLGFQFSGISTDSRKLSAGTLFVPLVGENYDGHDFMEAAADNGAAGFLAAKNKAGKRTVRGLPTVFVNDTLEALGFLARFARRKLKLKVIAVTGSVGKTTTKEMAARLIAHSGIKVLKTPGNLNNLIGLPLTLLGAVGDEEAAVLELGISEPGEMERLSAICEPDAAVITSAAACHTEGLGDVAGVAREKMKIAGSLNSGGALVLPHGDPWLSKEAAPTGINRLTFGWREKANIRGERFESLGALGTRFFVNGIEVPVGLPGKHNADNALAAVAAVQAAGIKWRNANQALASMTPSSLRGEIRRSKSGLNMIVDCYNANPRAACAALELLSELSNGAGTTAVLGEMRELGDLTRWGHEKVGEEAAKIGVGELHLVGESSKWIRTGAMARGMKEEKILMHDSVESLAKKLAARAAPGEWILIKGSRALGLEKVADALEQC